MHAGEPHATTCCASMKCPPRAWCTEELRVSLPLLARVGFDLSVLCDGSEKPGARRLASDGSWAETVCFMLAVTRDRCGARVFFGHSPGRRHVARGPARRAKARARDTRPEHWLAQFDVPQRRRSTQWVRGLDARDRSRGDERAQCARSHVRTRAANVSSFSRSRWTPASDRGVCAPRH